jgi:hypothetical protein
VRARLEPQRALKDCAVQRPQHALADGGGRVAGADVVQQAELPEDCATAQLLGVLPVLRLHPDRAAREHKAVALRLALSRHNMQRLRAHLAHRAHRLAELLAV